MQRSKSELITVDELLKMPDLSPTVYKHLTIHGSWIAIHVKSNYDYEISISLAKTPRQICEWLGQISEKTWCSKELLGELVMAFNQINGDLRSVK